MIKKKPGKQAIRTVIISDKKEKTIKEMSRDWKL
jgi:hypothetical protein